MTEDQYDAIGDRYEDAFVLPVFAVVHRAFHALAGDVLGLDVLDVATGSGVHARQWADAGARRAAPFTEEMAVNDPLVLFETHRP